MILNRNILLNSNVYMWVSLTGLVVFKGCTLDRLILLLDHFKHILSFLFSKVLAVSVYRIFAPNILSFLHVPSGAEVKETKAVCSCLLWKLWYEIPQSILCLRKAFFVVFCCCCCFLLADKLGLFGPFSYQWFWVMQRDFSSLHASSHPI